MEMDLGVDQGNQDRADWFRFLFPWYSVPSVFLRSKAISEICVRPQRRSQTGGPLPNTDSALKSIRNQNLKRVSPELITVLITTVFKFKYNISNITAVYHKITQKTVASFCSVFLKIHLVLIQKFGTRPVALRRGETNYIQLVPVQLLHWLWVLPH